MGCRGLWFKTLAITTWIRASNEGGLTLESARRLLDSELTGLTHLISSPSFLSIHYL